jgi:hypothetical protein
MPSRFALQGCYSPRPQPLVMKKKHPFSRYLSKLGRKGGKARLQTMTEEERKESARKAATARWAKAKKKSAGKPLLNQEDSTN